MLAALLALASSVCWGVADFAAGVKSRRLAVLTVLVVASLGSLPLILVVVAGRGAPAPGAGVALIAALAGLSEIVGLAAFYRGLAVGRMGVVAPISAAAAIVPVTVGLVSGERPSAVQAVGIVLALISITLVAREPVEAGGPSRTATGVGLATLAALGFGAFLVGIDAASEADPYWAILFSRSTGAAALAAAALLARPSFEMKRADPPALVAIGVADMGANMLFALASTLGLVALVGVVGSLYPAVVTLLARTVLGERLASGQKVGVLGTLVGVGLITGA